MGAGAPGLWTSTSQHGIPQNFMLQAQPDSTPLEVPGHASHAWQRAHFCKHAMFRQLDECAVTEASADSVHQYACLAVLQVT